MRLPARWHLIGLGGVLGLLLPLAGCSALALLGSTATAFAAGWLANAGLPQTDEGDMLVCYRNGLPVDCSTLPSSMLP